MSTSNCPNCSLYPICIVVAQTYSVSEAMVVWTLTFDLSISRSSCQWAWWEPANRGVWWDQHGRPQVCSGRCCVTSLWRHYYYHHHGYCLWQCLSLLPQVRLHWVLQAHAGGSCCGHGPHQSRGASVAKWIEIDCKVTHKERKGPREDKEISNTFRPVCVILVVPKYQLRILSGTDPSISS